MQNCKWKAVAM